MRPVNLFDYESLAEQRMAHIPWAWDYYQGGSEDEASLCGNRAAFEQLQLRPRVLVNVSTCNLRTSVLGTSVSMPILVALTAAHMGWLTQMQSAQPRVVSSGPAPLW